ncbi:FHA domain-containing protein [Gimesia panareensis]|uniref:FHA domain-containing protein n=1 Tax=Gimesia panareensis TaxID=2527978 RepID=UPI001187E6DE|nr:FHA domain-containing protein [Gimesia panareensis]QDU50231.1 FHA domain-containing protein FhaA [Gimesia panareensis]
MKIHLISDHPDLQDIEVSVDELPIVMGRSNSCALRVLDPMMSRHQCELSFQNNSVRVRDLESTNGTIVNSETVHEAPLYPGDILTVGMANYVVSYYDGDGQESFEESYFSENSV